MGEEVWGWVCLSVFVDFLFRVEVTVGGRVGIGMLLEMGRVCLVRREGAREATWGVVVRVCMRLSMFVSSSPVSM